MQIDGGPQWPVICLSVWGEGSNTINVAAVTRTLSGRRIEPG